MFSTKWQTSKRQYGIVHERDVAVPVSAGFSIDCDILRPAAAGNDQDLLREYAHSTRQILEDIERWGVKIHGKEAPFNAHPMIPWKLVTLDLDCLIHLAARARTLGVEFQEKIAVVDLLTEGDKVVGAIGFSLLDGATYIYKARAVVLANGNQNWRIMRMWSSGRGDGIAAAYRAGAKMRNAEFGTFVNLIHTAHHMVSYGSEDRLYNR